MFMFIFSIILAMVGLGFIIVRKVTEADNAVWRVWIFGVSLLALAGIFFLASCITTVGTKDIGVVTTYGKPTGRDLSNGLHLKAPWQSVTEMDGAIQSDEFSGKDNCINVRIGDSSTACAEITLRWRITPDEASTLYQNYRSNNVNETIRQSLVVTQLKAALNDTLGDYQPLANVNVASIKGQNNTQISAAPNLDSFSTKVTNTMNERLRSINGGKAQIEIVQVTLSFLHLSETTQTKINAFQAEVGQTRIAQQAEQTAIAQAQANKNLSQSVSHDPNVLVANCFDLVKDAAKQHYGLPAGFSCWPGDNGSIVIPAK